MTTKLNRIKSALRESIEIASKATDFIPYLGSEANATFLAHARTMTPLACKALLTAIEACEDRQKRSIYSAGLAEEILYFITSEWPDV